VEGWPAWPAALRIFHGPYRFRGSAQLGLRVIDSLQLTAQHKVATPVNWVQGEDVIIAGSVSNAEAKEIFGEWEEPKPYIRIVPQPV